MRIEGYAFYWHGQRVPGVTTILRVGGWREQVAPGSGALMRAMGRGTQVHAHLHAKDFGVTPEPSTPETQPYLDADDKLRQAFDFEPIDGERGLVHPEMRYGGYYDVFGVWRKKRILADRKTGRTVHPSTWLQLAAYKMLREFWFPDEKIDHTAVFLLMPTGEPRLILNPYEAFAAQTWVAALYRYRWIEMFGGGQA